MRDGWRLEILGEISEVIMGRQLSPSKKMGTRPRPYIRAANIGSWGISLNEIFEMDFTEDEEARFACRIGDTLLVEGGNEKSVGCPGLVTENEAGLCIQNTVIRCRVKNPEIFHPEFQYQILRYMYWRRDFAELCAGTTIMHLGQKRAELVPILLPPLPEQKRIVDLISSVDSYIEALQQQLESAKRSRNAVLHELLTAGGADWVETTLGEVVSVVNGGTPSTQSEDYWGGSIVWITTTELTAFDGKRVNSSKRTITADGLRNGPARLVRAGTTLVGTTATIGTCALADCELTFNQQISGLIPLDKNLDDSYLFYWIQHIKSILEGLSAGTSFKRISTSVLKTVSINFPPIGEQKRIAAVISEMDEFIESIQRTSIESKNLRSGLLSDLLSGDHEIPASYDKVIGAA